MLCLCLWPVRRGRVPVPRGAWVAAHRTSQKESSHAPQNGYAPIRYMFSSPLESQRFPSCRNGDKAGDTVRYKRTETANARPAQTRTKSHSQTGRSLGALRADLVGSAEVGGGPKACFSQASCHFTAISCGVLQDKPALLAAGHATNRIWRVEQPNALTSHSRRSRRPEQLARTDVPTASLSAVARSLSFSACATMFTPAASVHSAELSTTATAAAILPATAAAAIFTTAAATPPTTITKATSSASAEATSSVNACAAQPAAMVEQVNARLE